MNPLDVSVIAAMPVLSRTIPIGAYSALSSGRSFVWRLAWLGALGGAYVLVTVEAPNVGRALIDVALANAWLLVAANVMFVYANHVPVVPSFGPFVDGAASGAAGIFIPLCLFPSDMRLLVGPIGWEFALAAYSYVQECRGGRAIAYRDGLFFLLVNPELVFRRDIVRSNATARVTTLGGIRVIAGYSVVYGALVLQGFFGHTESVLLGVLVFMMVQYGLHSGRASCDVGMLRMLGYQVAERYRYPFLAKSPQDFWTRWNTYVGSWAKNYLFFPLNRSGRRAGLSRRQSVLLAVMMTFMSIGLMHDVTRLWNPRLTLFGFTCWFALNGVLLLAWRGAELAGRGRLASLPRAALRLVSLGCAFIALGIAAQALLS